MSKPVDKRKRRIRQEMRTASKMRGGGLAATIGRALALAVGQVALELPLPNTHAGVAFSVGLAAAGHTALRVAACSSSWSGDLKVLRKLAQMTCATKY